ncbi:Cupin type-1 domain-containing protein [Heracleum sosnowskyi]|uniref:Germin-like protein n=1 Tax=Heracleum sosnowskyi TaxID=360622 RepID=A0AAD8MZM9_9APIA|nr:Cupin type-1 domain-containing protein [Heracleum sosnowskyi]
MVTSLGYKILYIGFLSTITCFLALASDNNPLQDFCVAEANSPGGGAICKDPETVNENDFFTTGLHKAANTSNSLGSYITRINVARIPGLNTLGVSLARADFAPLGTNAPHIHPRASEIVTVIEGTLQVGFVTSGPEYRHITKVLNRGDVFVFPQGLVHYNQNIGNGSAVAIVGFNSQNPGTVAVANAVFGAKPHISAYNLAKSFQINEDMVSELQARF